MKRYYYTALLAALLLTGCYSEDAIKPTQLESMLDKFDFPQGTSEADEIFERIFEKYGTKVIYKDFTKMDVERAWINQADASQGGIATETTFGYITDPDDLLEAARTIEDKIIGLLPEDVMKKVLRAYPYIYLTDKLRQYNLIGVADTICIYPVKALDGIAINLEINADPDDYTYKVYYPLRIAMEFFNQAIMQKFITIPEEFYTMNGPIANGYLRSFQRSAEDPLLYDNYWARQGRIPHIGSIKGLASLSKTYQWNINTRVEPLTVLDRDTPWCFVFLSTDRNWCTYDDVQGVVDNTTQGIFYDCPRIVERLELFYNAMKQQGIDFDDIQRRLYDNPDDYSTVDTNPW